MASYPMIMVVNAAYRAARERRVEDDVAIRHRYLFCCLPWVERPRKDFL
jgi:hypothetical protein